MLLPRHPKDCLITKMYYGFGDTLMIRPFIKELASNHRFLYLDNPFPDLFYDIPNVRMVEIAIEINHRMRTHSKHSSRVDEKLWYPVPSAREFLEENKVAFDYQPTLNHKMEMTMFQYIEKYQVQFKNTKPEITLPPLRQEWIDTAKGCLSKWFPKRDKPVVFIHLPTIRPEWGGNKSRNCKPEYIQAILDRYKGQAYFFDVNDIKKGFEQRICHFEGLDIDVNDGSINLYELCAILTMVDLAVFPPGWILWASLALKFPSLCLWGGFCPSYYYLTKEQHLDTLQLVLPKEQCMCVPITNHECKKDLNVYEIFDRFERLLNEKHNTRKQTATNPENKRPSRRPVRKHRNIG